MIKLHENPLAIETPHDCSRLDGSLDEQNKLRTADGLEVSPLPERPTNFSLLFLHAAGPWDQRQTQGCRTSPPHFHLMRMPWVL